MEICEFPDEVIAVAPDVKRYRYLVRNDEIVVDPRERRVVEVID